MYTRIQSSKLYEQIAEQIKQRILRGELRTGDRLPTENELAEQFGASRTAIREAMKTLAQQGLIDTRPGRGAMVINATAQATRHSLELLMRVEHAGGSADLMEVREMLEPEIAALAARRATQDQVTAMQEAVQAMDASLQDADAYIAADNQFHRALAQGTQNVLMLALADSIVDLLSEQRKQIFAVEGGTVRGQLNHKRLLDAIRHHDPEAARQAMCAHLQQVRQDAGIAPAQP
jgi:DNA-binding FadR family transcriptional regulator